MRRVPQKKLVKLFKKSLDLLNNLDTARKSGATNLVLVKLLDNCYLEACLVHFLAISYLLLHDFCLKR